MSGAMLLAQAASPAAPPVTCVRSRKWMVNGKTVVSENAAKPGTFQIENGYASLNYEELRALHAALGELLKDAPPPPTFAEPDDNA